MASELPAEFALIARHFRPLAGPGALDLQDDAAVLAPPPGRELVLTCDAMVAGVHFLPDDPPDLVGPQAAAREPVGSRRQGRDADRLSDDGLDTARHAGRTVRRLRGRPQQDQQQYGVTLLGGDTTSTPGPISLSLTILGHVAPGQAVHRAGAPPGDGIWVTGTIGDGALGLAVARGQLADPTGYLLVPLPPATAAYRPGDRRHRLGRDGRLRRAGAGPRPYLSRQQCQRRDRGALRAAVRPARAAGPDWLAACLTGGDDYELLLAVPPARGRAATGRARRRHGRHPDRRLPFGAARGHVRDIDGKPMPSTTVAGAISETARGQWHRCYFALMMARVFLSRAARGKEISPWHLERPRN